MTSSLALTKYEANALITPRPYPQMYDLALGKLTAADFFSYPPSLDWVHATSRSYIEQVLQRCGNFNAVHKECIQWLEQTFEDQKLFTEEDRQAVSEFVERNVEHNQVADTNLYLLFQILIRHVTQPDGEYRLSHPLVREVLQLFGRFFGVTRFTSGVLNNLRDLLGTHCTSLRDSFSVPAEITQVSDYDEVAKKHSASFGQQVDQIIKRMNASQMNPEQVNQLLRNADSGELMKAFRKLPATIDELLDGVQNLQTELNDWLRDDQNYAKSLLDVVASLNSKLVTIETEIRVKKGMLKSVIQLLSHDKKNVETIGARLRVTKGHLKQVNDRMATLEVKREKLAQIIANREASASNKKDEAKTLKQRIRTHQQRRVFEAYELLLKKLERAESDVDKSNIVIRQLRFNQEAIDRQEIRLHTMKAKLEEDLRATQQIYDDASQRLTDRVASIRDQRQKTREDQRRASNLERTIKQVRALRQVKMIPESIKKINTARAIADNNVAKLRKIMLQRAFQIAADSIGPNWTEVYQALPFNPERSKEQRDQDIEAIRDSVPENARARTERDEALIAFNKWQVLNRSAKLSEFIETLGTKMPNPRPDIAKKIEEADEKHQTQVKYLQDFVTASYS